MNEYEHLAYKQAIWIHLIGQLESDLIVEDIQPAKAITCDVLPYNRRTVPQEALREVVAKLQKLADCCGVEMSKFKMVRQDHDGEEQVRSGATGTGGAADPAVEGKPVKAARAGRPSGKAAKSGGKGS
jgi:hypothetical protein